VLGEQLLSALAPVMSLAVEPDAALAHLEQAEQGLEHRALAGAVGAQQQRDLAALAP
jgi:hypothetical protein